MRLNDWKSRPAQVGEEEGLSVVLITHDLSIAERAGRLVRIRDGRLLEAATMGGR